MFDGVGVGIGIGIGVGVGGCWSMHAWLAGWLMVVDDEQNMDHCLLCC